MHELPLGSRQSKGRAIVNLLPFRQDESVRAVIATRDYKESKYLVFATKKGVVKKTEFLAYNTPLKADGIIAIKMREDDELIGVRLSDGDDDILMVSRGGQAIRFHESDVRAMGRDASGVRGMNLRSGDEVISVNVAQDDADLLVVTENGYGKRTPSARVSGQGPRRARREDGPADRRQGQARRRPRRPRRLRGDADLDERHGDPDARRGVKRLGRSTQGVIVMRLRGDDERVSSLAPVVESEGSDSTVEAAADAAVEAGIEPLAEPDFDEDGFPPAADDDDSERRATSATKPHLFCWTPFPNREKPCISFS